MGEISFGQYSCKSNASHALEGQGFNVISLLYVPGKDILVAGALSRSPVTTGEDSFHEEIQAHVKRHTVKTVSDRCRTGQDQRGDFERCESESSHGVHYPSFRGWPQCKEDVQ